MKFRNKILLSIWGLVLGLLIITFVILDYWMRIQIQSRFVEDIRSNYSTINEISRLRRDQVVKTSEVIAETPRLKAVAELRDMNTALQLSRELNQSMATDLFVLVDEMGKPLVGLLDGTPARLTPRELQLMKPAELRKPSANVLKLGDNVYRTASSPVIIGNDIVGCVIIGFKIVDEDIELLKSLTNSEVALLVDTVMVATSLAQEEKLELTRRLPSRFVSVPGGENRPAVFTIDAPGEKYVAAYYRINHASPGNEEVIAYLLLKPIERELRAVLTPLLNTFLIVSLVVLVIAGGIGYIISKGIARPIAALVQGTSEISRGNYDFRISVRTGGELKFLAQRFEEMSRSLKEKIQQLGQRNVELEEALRQLKDTEQELVKSERLAATGKLTAQLSHEINNPIHNIRSCLQTALQRISPDTPHRELLEAALEEIDRLSKLTQQMLDFYRTSMVQEERQRLNINDIVKEVLASSSALFLDGDIQVCTKLEQPMAGIDGSRDKLKQVFLNLFINARDAMPGGGTLSVETARENGAVMVNVSDDGIGISPENINRIFDAFFTTKSTVSGVGLGLSVTYGIMKQHDGAITVKSKVGEGTTFTLRFPIPSHS